jgi:hypothetical protein
MRRTLQMLLILCFHLMLAYTNGGDADLRLWIRAYTSAHTCGCPILKCCTCETPG